MVAIGQRPNRDVIVIGTSACAVEALPRLLGQLPRCSCSYSCSIWL